MTEAQTGNTVKVHYTGKLEDGTVFDSSVGGEPLSFAIGGGNIIVGFEEAVLGMSPGDSKTATIPSEKAYGPHRRELVMVVERQRMPEDLSLAIGQQLQISQSNGQNIPVTVTEVSESMVTLDANHPLAGEDLIFDIELVAIA